MDEAAQSEEQQCVEDGNDDSGFEMESNDATENDFFGNFLNFLSGASGLVANVLVLSVL